MKKQKMKRTRLVVLEDDVSNQFRGVAIALGYEPRVILKELVAAWTTAQVPKFMQTLQKQITTKAG